MARGPTEVNEKPMIENIRRLMLAITALTSAVAASGQEPPKPPDQPGPDKSQYSLFHPAPRQYLREMRTDRPDQTESPFTVDAGHLQLEMDLGYAEVVRGSQERTTWGVVPFNLRLGLLNNVDLHFVVDTYAHARTEDVANGSVDTASGFGDVQTRLKINFWGNEGGRTAFGVLPFVKWPLPRSGLRNGKTEGGVILPFALDLGRGWSLGAMTEFDFVADDAGDRETQFVNSVTVGHSVTPKLEVYAEFYTVTRRSPDFRWQGQADAGWTYALTQNLQLDAGCNFGVTRPAPDFQPFVGISFRR